MRLIFDITSLATWSGPPTGIVRAQRELARWARAYRPDVVFAMPDPRTGRPAALSAACAEGFLEGTATIDVWGVLEPGGKPWRKRNWLPSSIYAAFRIRRMALRILEHVRLTAPRSWRAALAEWLQRPMINERNRRLYLNADGSRRAHPTPDLAIAAAIDFGPGDVLVCAGNGWVDADIEDLARLKTASGFRLAVLCYDVIVLLFPRMFEADTTALMSRYWRACFAAADLVVFNSRAAASDAAAYCAAEHLAMGATAIAPLGADPPRMRSAAAAALGHGLEDGRYALFVSTIEPRKGHELLHRVWLRLLAEGVPQAHHFKLVFVGRVGWSMQALEKALADPRLAGTLVRLQGVDDVELDRLYRGAAFCVYPSLYEGYGLPLVEAFSRGKAVLSSDGGSLPEVVDGFSPTLPARDEDVWYAVLKAWIEDPAARAPYEAALRERWRHPSWDEAAAAFFGAIDAAFDPAPAEAVTA